MHVCQRYNFIFGMPQIYTCTDTQIHAHTSAETPPHTDTDSCTQTYISTHADIHRHTCIFFYIHKHTYIYVRSILPAHFIFSSHLPNELMDLCFLMNLANLPNLAKMLAFWLIWHCQNEPI